MTYSFFQMCRQCIFKTLCSTEIYQAGNFITVKHFTDLAEALVMYVVMSYVCTSIEKHRLKQEVKIFPVQPYTREARRTGHHSTYKAALERLTQGPLRRVSRGTDRG